MNTSDVIKTIPTLRFGNNIFYNLNFIESNLNKSGWNLNDFIINFPNLRNIGYADFLDNKNFDYGLYHTLCKQIEEADDKREFISLTFDTYIKLCRPSNLIKVDNVYYGEFKAAMMYLNYVNAEFNIVMIEEVLKFNPNILGDFLRKNKL